MCEPKTILCYGDSNTYGYVPSTGLRYPENVRWPGVLRKLLDEETQQGGERYVVIEEGCNGRTASVLPEDEPWKDGRPYLKACLNSHKPIEWVVLMLGSNDLKHQFHAKPQDIAGGIRWILQTIEEFLLDKQGYCPKVLLVSPPLVGKGIEESPFADRFSEDAIEKSMKLAELYEAEAEAFADDGKGIQCAFLDSSKIIDPSEIDSLHLMPDAHEKLGQEIAKILLQK
ncbi:MAG: acylhydrolase [Firmicutes bacterium]|nr:acylhydrolase [Bacillota bacterium]